MISSPPISEEQLLRREIYSFFSHSGSQPNPECRFLVLLREKTGGKLSVSESADTNRIYSSRINSPSRGFTLTFEEKTVLIKDLARRGFSYTEVSVCKTDDFGINRGSCVEVVVSLPSISENKKEGEVAVRSTEDGWASDFHPDAVRGLQKKFAAKQLELYRHVPRKVMRPNSMISRGDRISFFFQPKRVDSPLENITGSLLEGEASGSNFDKSAKQGENSLFSETIAEKTVTSIPFAASSKSLQISLLPKNSDNKKMQNRVPIGSTPNSQNSSYGPDFGMLNPLHGRNSENIKEGQASAGGAKTVTGIPFAASPESLQTPLLPKSSDEENWWDPCFRWLSNARK